MIKGKDGMNTNLRTISEFLRMGFNPSPKLSQKKTK